MEKIIKVLTRLKSLNSRNNEIDCYGEDYKAKYCQGL